LVIIGLCRGGQALISGDEAGYAGGRKFKPKGQNFGREIDGRVVRFAFAIGKLRKQLDLFERLLTDGLALGAQGAELGHIPFDGALDTLLIESQELEVFGVVEPGVSSGDRFADGEVGGVCSFTGGHVAELAQLAGGEDSRFEGAGEFEAPAILSDGLCEIEFQGADGLERLADAGTVELEGLVLGLGEETDLAGEAVTVGIETGAMLAGFGFWTGGALCVG